MSTIRVSAVASRIGAARPWTCSTCRTQIAHGIKAESLFRPRRFFSYKKTTSQPQRPATQQGGKGRILLLASGGVVAGAGASLVAFGDDIKTSYEAVERAGRVAAALGICINEYVLLPGYFVSRDADLIS